MSAHCSGCFSRITYLDETDWRVPPVQQLSEQPLYPLPTTQVMADTDVDKARTLLPAAGLMDTADTPDSVDWRDKSQFYLFIQM